MHRTRYCCVVLGSIAVLVVAARSIAADAPIGSVRCQAKEVFDVRTGSCRPPITIAPMKAQKDRAFLAVPRKIPGSATAYELHLVETRDEIYVPVGVRKPAGP